MHEAGHEVDTYSVPSALCAGGGQALLTAACIGINGRSKSEQLRAASLKRTGTVTSPPEGGSLNLAGNVALLGSHTFVPIMLGGELGVGFLFFPGLCQAR